MKNLFTKKEDKTVTLYEERGRILSQMKAFAGEDDEYENLMRRLSDIEEIIANYRRGRVEFKDWLPVIGTVGSVLLVITFEAAGHTITSKAFGRIPMPR